MSTAGKYKVVADTIKEISRDYILCTLTLSILHFHILTQTFKFLVLKIWGIQIIQWHGTI